MPREGSFHRLAVLGALACVAVAWAAILARNEEGGQRRLRAELASFAEQAKMKPMPSYPEAAAREGVEGVVVARVQTDPLGEVVSVEVLEAPDARIAGAVRRTLSTWSFEVPSVAGSGAVGVEGKIVLYFSLAAATRSVELATVPEAARTLWNQR